MMTDDLRKRRTVLYIAYGENTLYHYGAIFSILRLLGHSRGAADDLRIMVYTDKPALFAAYPVESRAITPETFARWSLEGKYHFRVKNRAIAAALRETGGPLLFLDSDFLPQEDIRGAFRTIEAGNAILYRDEGPLQGRENPYIRCLSGRDVPLPDGQVYRMKPNTHMWGSAIIGLDATMLDSLEFADVLIRALLPVVPDHTIEQFALSEALQRSCRIVPNGIRFTDYSSGGRKAFAEARIRAFFAEHGAAPLDEQIGRCMAFTLRRTFPFLLRQKLAKLGLRFK